MNSDSILKSTIPTQLGIKPQDILESLRTLKDPETKKPLLETNRLGDVFIDTNRIHITLHVSKEDCARYEKTSLEIQRLIKSMPALKTLKNLKVFVVMTAHKNTPQFSLDASTSKGNFDLLHIKDIVAIASGKGGVGKSTTTVNLAYALRGMGFKVGILDADIYGPSVPKMLSLSGKPEIDQDNLMIPMEKDGIQVMSMAFLVADDTPVIWRGPIVQKAIQQFLNQVRWPSLDILLLDLPPGTGDIQLTLVQKVRFSGAIVVSTPQDIALIDARKAIAMFQKVEVPLLGLIENMSYFQCPHCQERSHIFSHGGARKTADVLEVPFLAEVPLALKIREMTDQGAQADLVKEEALGLPYRQVAKSLLTQLQSLSLKSRASS